MYSWFDNVLGWGHRVPARGAGSNVSASGGPHCISVRVIGCQGGVSNVSVSRIVKDSVLGHMV